MGKFKILTCGNYVKEIEFIIKRLELSDAEMSVFPTQCTHCLCMNIDKMNDFIEKNHTPSDLVWMLGDTVPIDKKVQCPCQTTVVNISAMIQWQSEGYYLATPGWLQNWKKLFYDIWGFNEESLKKFAEETIRKIMVLDTGVYENTHELMQEFASACAVESKIVHVGLDYLELSVSNDYWKWKYNNENNQLQEIENKIADYNMAFNMVSQFSFVREAHMAASIIESIGMMITAGGQVHYSSINEVENPLVSGMTKDGFQEGWRTEQTNGFSIGMMFAGEPIGIIEFKDVMLPERIESYMNLFKNLAPVFSIALINANQFEELIKEKMAVEKANQSKDIFLSTMSHEVRTPLNGVSAALQLLRRSHLNSVQTTLLEIAEDATRSLLESVNNVLDYTKIKSSKAILEKTAFSVSKVIEDVFSTFKASALTKGIALLASDMSVECNGLFLGDAFRLKQVLNNLINNAIKFTNEGNISVHVRCIQRTNEKDVVLEFSVEDTGIGIPDNKLKEIFKPFEQGSIETAHLYGGTGLGLAISKELVFLMGGTIDAANLEHGGSRFTFTCAVDPIDHSHGGGRQCET